MNERKCGCQLNNKCCRERIYLHPKWWLRIWKGPPLLVGVQRFKIPNFLKLYCTYIVISIANIGSNEVLKLLVFSSSRDNIIIKEVLVIWQVILIFQCQIFDSLKYTEINKTWMRVVDATAVKSSPWQLVVSCIPHSKIPIKYCWVILLKNILRKFYRILLAITGSFPNEWWYVITTLVRHKYTINHSVRLVPMLITTIFKRQIGLWSKVCCFLCLVGVSNIENSSGLILKFQLQR